MPNRRANKKLRARVLSRMNETGESYQKALAHLLAAGDGPATPTPTPAGRGAGARPRRRSVRQAAPASPLLLYQHAVALVCVAEQVRRLDGEASSATVRAEALATFAVYWRASGRPLGTSFWLGGDATRALQAGADLVERARSAARLGWLGHPSRALAGAASPGRSKR
ncbi:hypothetical protein [Sorangium sp. So ce131]|uniref:hypothetical protein n=1 Tax=Sorangium sp. So ce131 TaxID=3133282 RepID=UPI003F604193